NAETHDVAKNPDFQAFVVNVALVVAKENPADVSDLLTKAYPEGGTVQDALTNKIAVIGENMTIRRFERMEGVIATYNHDNGRIGVMTLIDAPASDDVTAMGKNLCMHIAMYAPKYIAQADVPAEVVAHEQEVLKTQAMNEGKPEAIAEKMVQGRIRKFFSEVCLLDQAYIMDEDITVAKYIDTTVAGAKVLKFVRYEKGEGIEKREDNFADEIASMLK
ncbi:MAG: translation elongation factor Ts, partial [Clostridia bacterium]|nr:translation elongation factor Ts [Clostridia bacterium]